MESCSFLSDVQFFLFHRVNTIYQKAAPVSLKQWYTYHKGVTQLFFFFQCRDSHVCVFLVCAFVWIHETSHGERRLMRRILPSLDIHASSMDFTSISSSLQSFVQYSTVQYMTWGHFLYFSFYQSMSFCLWFCIDTLLFFFIVSTTAGKTKGCWGEEVWLCEETSKGNKKKKNE